MQDLAGQIAPGFLCCESGSDDDSFPEAGVRAALEHAQRIYSSLWRR